LMDSEDQPLLLPIYMAHYLLMLMDYRDSGSGARDSGLGVRDSGFGVRGSGFNDCVLGVGSLGVGS
jgi:hypothetical protein